VHVILALTLLVLVIVAAFVPMDARRKRLAGGTTARRFSARRGPVRLVGGQTVYGRW
jgi:hypothetical protein